MIVDKHSANILKNESNSSIHNLNNPLMKKSSFILLFLLLAVGAFAQQAWTVKTVPNTRMQSNAIHVSDPDGYLSDSAEVIINTALCAIRDTADVFVVTLSSIGEVEPKPFATELLNYWGIGNAKANNGVLLLFVEDQHALEFETGYGAEGILTDVKCQQIFNHTIVPYFRAGDYEGGLCAGVAEIVEVFGGEVPVGLMDYMPAVGSSDSDSDSDASDEDVGGMMLLVSLMIMVLPFVGMLYWAVKRKKKATVADACKLKTEDGVTYLEGSKTLWSGSPWEGNGCLGGLMIGCSLLLFVVLVVAVIEARFPGMPEKTRYNWGAGIGLLLYLTWICFRQGQRTLKVADDLAKKSVSPKGVYKTAFNHTANKIAFWMAPWLGWLYIMKLKSRMEHSVECQCPTCHGKMRKDTGFKLSETKNLENRLGAMSYRPFCCDNGHHFVLKDKGKNYADFSTCSQCGAFTLKKTHSVTLSQATYSHSGEKEETYECQNCGHSFKKKVVIPMKVSYTSSDGSSGSSGRSYSSHSSSHSSGGSFGGGRSGGGGFSGRW